MKYSRIPPGESPVSDAFNLMVAAMDKKNGERVTRTIENNVTDWKPVAVHLCALAALYAGFAEKYVGDERPVAFLADKLSA